MIKQLTLALALASAAAQCETQWSAVETCAAGQCPDMKEPDEPKLPSVDKIEKQCPHTPGAPTCKELLDCKLIQCTLYDINEDAEKLIEKCGGCGTQLNAFLQCGLEAAVQEYLNMDCTMAMPPADYSDECKKSDGAFLNSVSGFAAAAAVAAAL